MVAHHQQIFDEAAANHLECMPGGQLTCGSCEAYVPGAQTTNFRNPCSQVRKLDWKTQDSIPNSTPPKHWGSSFDAFLADEMIFDNKIKSYYYFWNPSTFG
jgi:hypothetical protein